MATTTVALACAATAIAPATASADGLIAASEHYVAGKGFEIRLVNVATGAQLPVPAEVNTTADELHPALSPDGRQVVFMRTQLQPKLNGDIVPPVARSLVRWDRTTGGIATLRASEGAGPVFRQTGSTLQLAWGIRPAAAPQGGTYRARHAAFAGGAIGTITSDVASASPDGQLVETTHAAFVPGATSIRDTTNFEIPLDGRYLSIAGLDSTTGALVEVDAVVDATRVDGFGFTQGPGREFGTPQDGAGHTVPRPGDNYVAFHQANGADVDIQTFTFPNEPAAAAPSPITTTDPERMPAWSPPLGNQLGYVRSTAGRRALLVFDLTPGLQTPLNPPIDIGPEAPTPQTRSYQNVWGGLSLALSPDVNVPTVTCSTKCVAPPKQPAAGTSPIGLRPRVSLTTPGQLIGIVVARVTGTRKLLGRTVPRIRPVGRVPLGKTKRGLNRFRWNGKVEGKRLKPGTYLLTYRSLKRGRILSTSGSLRFTVTKKGAFRNVRRQR
jgi:hypothetical protein